MADIDFNKFRWFSPRQKNGLSITIPNALSINLNPRLAETVQVQIEIGIDGPHTLCLRPSETGYKVPKSGSIHTCDVIATLITLGLSLPAKYAVTREDSCWLATLEPQAVPIASNPAKIPHKPRVKGLDRLMDKENVK